MCEGAKKAKSATNQLAFSEKQCVARYKQAREETKERMETISDNYLS